MEEEKYKEIVKRYLSEYEIEKVDELPDLVRVDIRPCKIGWGICTFIFTKKVIACFGDVEAFTWHTTWDAVSKIKDGNCYARDTQYLIGKLEHKDLLEEFEFDEDVMKEIKGELSEDLDEDELEEFNEKWDDNEYLLGDIDKYHLDKLDEFFEEIGVSDGWEYYSRFEELPNHCYCAVAMLRCIEDYFKNRAKAVEL